jgi:hypothetical protein
VDAASGLPDTLHYKNPARLKGVHSNILNTFGVKMNCPHAKIMLQNFSKQAISGLDRGDHAILVSVLAACGPSTGAAGLGLGR